MNFKSVLIVTYGRSGSTLLQGLLNSIEGCLIRGENYNLCYGMFMTYRALCRTRQEYGNYDRAKHPISPWYGASNLDEELFISDARRLVMHQLLPQGKAAPSPSCFGFKEIRYLPSHFPAGRYEITEYLDFLAKLFPNPALISLGRDHRDVLKSGWWKKKNPDAVKKALMEFESAIEAYSRDKPYVFQIRYEDITGRTARLRQLFDFLGVPCEEEEVDRVLSTKHSYGVKKTTPDVGRLKVEVVESRALSLLKVDNIKEKAGGDMVLAGLAVLRGDLSLDEHVIIARHEEQEYTVNWGQPSPAMAKQYPDNVNSGNSRFQVDRIPADVAGPITLVLVGKDKDSESIARIWI